MTGTVLFLAILAVAAPLTAQESGTPKPKEPSLHSVRCNAYLEDLRGVVRRQELRATEVGKSSIRSFDVLGARPDPKVHVLGVAWFRVVDEGHAPDDQILDSMPMEQQFGRN